MNQNQKIVLGVGLACFCFACLYVPWNHGRFNAGYFLLFRPPESYGGHAATIDVSRMLPPILVIIVVTGAALFFLKSSPKPDSQAVSAPAESDGDDLRTAFRQLPPDR